MPPPFTGVGVALVTLFNAHGRVLTAATADHAARLAAAGMRAIVVAGTTGEGNQLNADDRRRLLAAVKAAVPESLPVLVGTGSPTAARSLEFTRVARDGGAAGVLAYPPDDEEAGAFFARQREVAGELAVLAYHFPRHYPPIPVASLARLDADGMKDSEGDADRLRQETAEWDRPVYSGSAPLLSVAAERGATGAILALANLRPEGCAQAFTGDAEAQAALLPDHETLRAGGVAALKEALAREHGTSAHMRRIPQPARA